MAAGTVISGGFPGRVAQEVQPNEKCAGCLHYDGQAGRTGACTIGLRPWLCGDGEAQEVGYAPLARGAGNYLPDMSNHGAHAPEVPTQFVSDLYGSGSTRPVQVHQVALGEEHVHLVKSLVERHSQLQKSQCRLCSMAGTHGTAPPNVGFQLCTCAPLEARVVAKAVVSRMSNAQRVGVALDDVVEWVRDVVKAGFKVPFPKKARSLGSRVIDPERRAENRALNRPRPTLSDQVTIDGNGGHLRPIEKGTYYHPSGRYDVSPAGGGSHHIDFTPRTGGPQTRLPGTFPSHGAARRAAIAHGERIAAGSGKVTPSTSAPTRQIKVGRDNASSMESVDKSESRPGATFVASHGTYKFEHHPDHVAVHYQAEHGSPAPSQRVKFKTGQQAVNMKNIHSFVNEHSLADGGHATLHSDHVKVHLPDVGEVHHVTTMKQARGHLGY